MIIQFDRVHFYSVLYRAVKLGGRVVWDISCIQIEYY